MRAFIEQYRVNPDHPVLQDFVVVMRRFAPDAAAYDDFVRQWFFEVVVPEYRLSDGGRLQVKQDSAAPAETWEITVRVEQAGTGRMPVEVAAVAGEQWTSDGEPAPDYRDGRMTVVLGAGESQEVRIRCGFKPVRVVVDPAVVVLQLLRKHAVLRF